MNDKYQLITSTSDGDTALALASKISSTAIMDYLLSSGADPNIPNNEGLTPLSIFLRRMCKSRTHPLYSNLETMVMSFIATGAHIHTDDHPPLAYACQLVNKDIVKKILKLGAPVNLVSLISLFANLVSRQNSTRCISFLKAIRA